MTHKLPPGLHLPSSTLIWDNHGCMPLRTDDEFLPQIERYRASGVHVVSINIGFGDTPLLDQLQIISHMRAWIARYPDRYRLVSLAADILKCQAEGKLGIVFDIEGMDPVQDDPGFVKTFYELGVRWMLIAYNKNNRAGGGCLDVDCGLTDTGKKVIDEMERVGMVLCLSHAGHRTVMEAIEYSSNPPIFSHSNPFGDVQHPRNISDEAILACAQKGGVIGVSGIGPFLGSNTGLVAHLLRQIRYLTDLVGHEHIGLGLDYVFDRSELDTYVSSNPALFPPGVTEGLSMVAPESIAEICNNLADSSFSDVQIQAIMGGNWLRIAQQVWK